MRMEDVYSVLHTLQTHIFWCFPISKLHWRTCQCESDHFCGGTLMNSMFLTRSEARRRLEINKCDAGVGGRSLRPGTMASVAPEVSVRALSMPSFFYFHADFRPVAKLFRLDSQKHPVKRSNYRRRCVFMRRIPRCCSTVPCFCAELEGNWMCRKMLCPGTWMFQSCGLRALLRNLFIHGAALSRCPASFQFSALN